MERSAGILIYRRKAAGFEVFLVHPGGPFWAHKDEGSWSIPKGLLSENENSLDAAKREFLEEIGTRVSGGFEKLGEFRQPSGKIITAWTVEFDLDETKLESNTFEIEWPPKTGRVASFPEVDRAGWFSFREGCQKITKGQIPILLALAKKLNAEPETERP